MLPEFQKFIAVYHRLLVVRTQKIIARTKEKEKVLELQEQRLLELLRDRTILVGNNVKILTPEIYTAF